MKPRFEVTPELVARFEKFLKRAPSGCLVFTGSRNEKGYGWFSINGINYKAHRVAWIIKHGWIEEKQELDHLPTCSRACCDVDHLKLTDHITNATGGAKHNAAKTHCPRGHLYGPDDFRWHRGRRERRCRACRKLGWR